ncbi:branched-chain amino acid transport system II carrier protein [Clostridium weizhouense]|uniref:Branched-chain amino acid transport system carrier protein n=1 Tax=Clostridium weizhouense TaxID=2859781 RepID=A0ABS7AQ64_9CLOT|nr:branched-chain amino acid transport system II carrier protein [Clostridium weizhouense]MBW6410808.1 branched-chain amino acid transport system II carrier protein [Clostridium weizhouense]
MKKSTKDVIIIGFALFAMFFGAGNLIFPPFLGRMIGDQYILGIIGFVCTGVGLPLLAIIAATKGDGTFETMASKIGPKFSIIFATILFITIGPMLAIPRTAATTYELTISPLVPNLSPLISMIIYFAVNLLFVIKRSSIIDTIGKYLTPMLIVILTLIIIKGIVSPIGHVTSTGVTSVLPSSFIEGYQTMDALAGLLFATVITTTLREKKYSDKELLPMTLKASGVAVIGLAFIYGGLMFLGAQTSGFEIADLSKTSLLLLISNNILGNIGTTIIGIAIGLACLTTSIGLLTAGSSFFEKVSNGKLPYKINAIVISLISIFIGSLGVDKIVKISGPILSILYPVTITLIVTTLVNRILTNRKAVRIGVYTSLIFGIFEILPFIDLSFIPLAKSGFAWLIPTIISILIGYIIFPMSKQKVTNLC